MCSTRSCSKEATRLSGERTYSRAVERALKDVVRRAKARRILEAMEEAAKAGRGAVSLDGRLIDIASIRMAEALIEKADAMKG